ncbi:hypothetical protein PHMEG_00035077 [Phytophthora megakarya]|uniref:Uncharacterized protein n=1 Tax=Phytophthora megakarya TaxID=4795 RepID=A0A225UPJ7_9STRA|nr:hypothetical protein PHMEG_00035077 [Phytophthora megakarya]
MWTKPLSSSACLPIGFGGITGIKGSGKVQGLKKDTDRMGAVLTIRAEIKIPPILLILCGKLGGTIDSRELDTLSNRHFYTVQETG